MKNLLKRLDNKKVAVISVVLFVLTMLPIWYLSMYARPSGDDYGYSVLTHAAWLETHSLWQVVKAGIQTVKDMYVGWNGDWFTTFLFSLMPEVFKPYTFWITPIIMTAVMIAGTSIFLYEVCVKVMKFSKEDFVICDVLILVASYQFIPSTAIGMYWYVGAVHYIIPHAAALLALTFASRLYRTGKLRNIAYAGIFTFMVGGGSYFSSLLIFMVYFLLVIFCVKKRKEMVWLSVPFAICLAGFIIQCLSPGNVVRAGEGFGLHLSQVFGTVVQSLWTGVVTIGDYCTEKTAVIILLLLLLLFSWETHLKCERAARYRYPFLFVILMYGLYSAMFAPEIYSAVDVSLGPATIQYFTFLLAAAGSIWYCEGWAVQRVRSVGAASVLREREKYRFRILFPAMILCGLLILLNRGWLRNSVDMRIYDYVSSGQAEDFRSQIASQMEILLDDSIKEAYLVPINQDQGPLMHMPVTADEDNFTNRVVKNFYQKDKVIMKTTD